MKMIVAFVFYFLYWFICFLCTGTDRKNLAGLRSYPDAVQKAVREHPVLGKAAPQEKSIGTAFWFFLTLGEGLGGFDLVIIDLLWWRNTKRIRFSFLPERSHYQDPTKHISSFLRGIPLFALVAVLSALIVQGAYL